MKIAKDRILEQETDRLLAFADIIAKIAGGSEPDYDLDHLCASALHNLVKVCPLSAGALALVEADQLIVRAIYGEGLDRAPGLAVPRTSAAVWQVVTTGETLYGQNEPHEYHGQPEQSSRYLALPLSGNGQVFGVLELQSLPTQTFDETEVALLQTIATVLCSRIAQAYQLQALQADVASQARQVGRIAAQYTVTRILSEASTFMDVAEAILQTIGEQLGWEIGLMWCVQSDTNTLACTALWSAVTEQASGFLTASRQLHLPTGDGLPGRVWESKEPHWLSNIRTDQNFPRSTAAAQAGLHSAFAFPIIGQNVFFGVMEFFSRDFHTPDAELLHTTAALGRQMGQFIERRRAQQAQQQSEQYTVAILETALDGIIGMNETGRITEWNPAAERIFGYQRADVLGQQLGELIVPPALREQHRQGLARYLETGAAYVLGRRLELTAVRADGTEFPVELAIARVPSGAQRFTGYVRDISERKRAEEAIRFQARLLDVVEQAVIATDVSGIITYWNHYAEKLYGWSADEALGRNILDITLAPEAQEQAAHIMDRLRVGESWAAEFMVHRRDGTQFPAMVIDSPIFDAEGAVIGIVGVSQDISAAKRAERAQAFLIKASALLSTSLDSGETLQQVADLAVPELADWCVVDLRDDDGSTRLMAVAHIDPEKVALARRLRERYPVDENAPHGVPLVLRTGQPELIPTITEDLLQASARDAEHLQLLHNLGLSSAMIVPLHARGRTLGAITLIAAESGRHYDQSDLAFAQELAGRAAMAIDNAKLYQTAQSAIQLRDEFLSIASHELKTPLTTMLGHSQALLRRATRQQQFGERDRSGLQSIVDQTQRLNKQITTLLDVSRLELGQFRIEHAPVDVAALTSRVVVELEPTLERHTLHLVGAAEPLIVEGDERLLEQVLQNLLNNAVKYSVNGGTITIRLWHEAGTACVSISDQGMGIPLSAQSHLFQRFYRANNVDAHRISGLGIGLYLVHEIVMHHGGTVDVASAEGLGSTFTVRVPLARTAPTPGSDQA